MDDSVSVALQELLERARDGRWSRREFVARALALGVVATTANAWAETAFGQEVTRTAGAKLKIASAVGRSPKVLTQWQFKINLWKALGERARTATVRWSGSGTFEPKGRDRASVTFHEPGANVVKAVVKAGGETLKAKLQVEAKDAALYARVGSKAECAADAHGCPACPHVVVGPVQSGSPEILLDGKPAARVDDFGIHAACCGPNMFHILDGDEEVLIHGKAAAMRGSKTQHCGGEGEIITV